MRRLAIPALAIFAIDQLSKWYVVFYLDLLHVGQIDVWDPYLRLIMAWNRGINFGLFANDQEAMRWALIGVAVTICLGVLWWMRNETNKWALISGGILFGGAAGNVVDRIVYGAVADFLNMSCCGINNPFAFNVADIAIFVGAIGLVAFASEGTKPERS